VNEPCCERDCCGICNESLLVGGDRYFCVQSGHHGRHEAVYAAVQTDPFTHKITHVIRWEDVPPPYEIVDVRR
jgi:hypothetical protein